MSLEGANSNKPDTQGWMVVCMTPLWEVSLKIIAKFKGFFFNYLYCGEAMCTCVSVRGTEETIIGPTELQTVVASHFTWVLEQHLGILQED